MPALDHLAHLTAEVGRIDELLRDADLGAAVPDCPGWLLRDLVLHLGGVHRWATGIVHSGQKQPPAQPPVPDEQLRAWFLQGAAALRAELAVDPQRPVWTLAGDGTAAFWRRRQAVETAVHRVDAERCLGVERPVADELAEEGVAEVVDVLHPRQVRLGRSAAPTCAVRLEATTGRSWLIGDGPTCASVSGSPSDLLLLLWRRERRRSSAFTVDGDTAALDGLLASGLTP